VGAATSLHGDERRLTIDEELQHPVALELDTLDLGALDVHDMDLKLTSRIADGLVSISRAHSYTNMMKTETAIKLEDSQVQLRLVKKFIEDEETVRSCINSFVSLARSITFVMQAESGGIPALSDWYDEQMAQMCANPLLKFFNAKRVYSVHKGSIVLVKAQYAFLAPAQIAGCAYLAPPHITGWLFDDTEQFGVAPHTSAVYLCEQYVSLMAGLVQDWHIKRLEFNI
jgi:hypothetical protein